MTIELFIKMFILGGAVTSVLTEVLKKVLDNGNITYSANVAALVNAIVVGIGGTALCYVYKGIPWTANNIISMVLMGVAVWMASMVGYDKILQMIRQLGIFPVPDETVDE